MGLKIGDLKRFSYSVQAFCKAFFAKSFSGYFIHSKRYIRNPDIICRDLVVRIPKKPLVNGAGSVQ